MSENQLQKQNRFPTLVVVVAVLGVGVGLFFFVEARVARSRLEEKNSALERAKSDLGRSQAWLKASEQRAVDLSKQLEETGHQLEQAKSKITGLEPLAAKAREMPVSASFRKALLGSGYVLTLRNKTAKSLPLNVAISDADAERKTSFRVVVDGSISSHDGFSTPGPAREIGYAEGWAFASGDSVEISCAGFDSIRAKVP